MIIRSREIFHAHASSLLELDKVCFPASHWDKSVWEGLFNNHDLRVAANISQSIFTGYAVFSKIQEEAELLRIGIRPDFREEGIAHALTERMIGVLKKEQVKRLFLEVRDDNLPALSLYRSFGFMEIGKRTGYYKNPKGNALTFSLDLRKPDNHLAAK